MFAALSLSLALWMAAPPAPADKVVKETLGVGGKTRTYHLLVPDKVTPEEPAPLMVLLHGSGRDGRSQIDPWTQLARQHGIVLVAPDSSTRQGWSMVEDGPGFLYALVEMIRLQHPVDPRRIYVFGHSAGALHGLAMAVLESEYFAAAAVHAGVLPDPMLPFLERAPRKIPIAIWVGTLDPLFPLDVVRATRSALSGRGFDARLTEISGHGHGYYDRAPEINLKVWEFLQKHRLDADPKYQPYEMR